MFKKMIRNAVLKTCKKEINELVEQKVKYEISKHKVEHTHVDNGFIDEKVTEKIHEAFSKKVIVPKSYNFMSCVEPVHVKGLTGQADGAVKRVASEYMEEAAMEIVGSEDFIDNIIDRIKRKQL